MIIFGILSILQMTLFPGVLAVKIIKGIDRGIPRLVVIFGFSLVFNYFLVFILSALHAYTKNLLLVFIFLELVALIWLYRETYLLSFETIFEQIGHWLQSLRLISLKDSIDSSFLRVVEYFVFLMFFIFAMTDIVWITRIFFNNFGTVFTTWDAVLSWNHWATIWSQGTIPSGTQFYPQLIPANWSLSYVLMNGYELQSFPKVIMPLFSLFMLLMLLDLGLKTRSFGFFIGIIFSRLIIKKFTGEYIADGYVDLAVTFFGFASVYLLLLARLKSKKERIQKGLIIAGLIMVTGSALTKQAGIVTFLMFPALTYLIVFYRSSTTFEQINLRTLLISFLGALALVGTWYLFKWFQIQTGLDSSNVAYITQGIYQGADIITRARNALDLLGIYKYFLFALIPAVLLIKSPYRWPGILVAIPFSTIWLFYFSYEARNLALIFPIWGMMIGLMSQQLFDWSIKLLTAIKAYKVPIALIFVAIISLFVFLAIRYPLHRLLHNQEEKQWLLFNPELNQEIRSLIDQTGPEIKILTNYPVDYLPGLRGVQVSYWYDNLADYKHVTEKMRIDYLLVPQNIAPNVENEIQSEIQTGRLRFLFSSEGSFSYRMFEKID